MNVVLNDLQHAQNVNMVRQKATLKVGGIIWSMIKKRPSLGTAEMQSAMLQGVALALGMLVGMMTLKREDVAKTTKTLGILLSERALVQWDTDHPGDAPAPAPKKSSLIIGG